MATTLGFTKSFCAASADVGFVLDDARLVSRINEAQRRLINWYNLLVRREEYDLPQKTWVALTTDNQNLALDEVDATKLQVLSFWREENNLESNAGALQASARGLVQENLFASVESTLKAARQTNAAGTAFTKKWYFSKIGLDVPTSFPSSDTKLRRLVERAGQWVYQRTYEYQLNERNRIYDSVPTLATIPADDTTPFNPPIEYEVMRLIGQAFLSEGAVQENVGSQAAGTQMLFTLLTAEAAQLLTRRLDAELEALRHGAYTAALEATTVDTLGRFVAKTALEIPGGLRLSKKELVRLVNAAEQRLIESGKWKGSIADAEIEITEDGEVLMPDEFETVLAATINRRPALIKGRWFEFIPGGPGLQGGCSCVRSLLIDRGTDGATGRRIYFVLGGCPEGDATLHIRGKRRFVYKTQDSEVMQMRNYSAMKNAIMGIVAEGWIMESARNPQLAAFYWSVAGKILADAEEEFLGDSASKDMPVQMENFTAWNMPHVM